MDRAIKNIELPREERIELRKQEPYKILSKDCDFECHPLDRDKDI